MMTKRLALGTAVCVLAVACAVAPCAGAGQSPQAPPPAAQVTPDPWPRTIAVQGAKYSLYQPQVDTWDSRHLQAHAAVSVLPTGAKAPVFGVIEITATTDVDRVSRTVYFRD